MLNLFQDPLKNKERSRVKEARDDVGEGSATENSDIVGFIIGKLTPAPEVYNPGGLTLMIDDFCVKDETQWDFIGAGLVQEIKKIAKPKDAAQILVVAGAWDKVKIEFLKSQNLAIASEWYVGNIS